MAKESNTSDYKEFFQKCFQDELNAISAGKTVIPEALLSNTDFMFVAIKINSALYDKAPAFLKHNKNFLLEALRNGFKKIIYGDLPEALRNV